MFEKLLELAAWLPVELRVMAVFVVYPAVAVLTILALGGWWRYERRRKHPIVYVCRVDGVIGIVRREDFEEDLHWLRGRHGKQREKPLLQPLIPRPGWLEDRLYHKIGPITEAEAMNNVGVFGWMVNPLLVFIFSDKNPPVHHRLTGTMADYRRLVVGCYVEQHTFVVPPMKDYIGPKTSHSTGPSFGRAWRHIHGKGNQPPYEVSPHLQVPTAATV